MTRSSTFFFLHLLVAVTAFGAKCPDLPYAWGTAVAEQNDYHPAMSSQAIEAYGRDTKQQIYDQIYRYAKEGWAPIIDETNVLFVVIDQSLKKNGYALEEPRVETFNYRENINLKCGTRWEYDFRVKLKYTHPRRQPVKAVLEGSKFWVCRLTKDDDYFLSSIRLN